MASWTERWSWFWHGFFLMLGGAFIGFILLETLALILPARAAYLDYFALLAGALLFFPGASVSICALRGRWFLQLAIGYQDRRYRRRQRRMQAWTPPPDATPPNRQGGPSRSADQSSAGEKE